MNNAIYIKTGISYRDIGALVGGAGKQRGTAMHMCTHVSIHVCAPLGVVLLPPKREREAKCVLVPSLALYRGLLILGGPSLET